MPDAAQFTHRVVTAAHAETRQREAAAAVAAHPVHSQVLLLGPSLEAGSRALRRAVEGRAGAFGYQRATPTELATRLASTGLARAGRVQVSSVVLEALAARRVRELLEAGALGRYTPVGERPGLPRALARAFTELGLAAVGPDHPALPPDLARVYAAYRDALSVRGLADRAAVIEAALARVADPTPHPLLDHPVILFDVALRSALEERLVAALAGRAPVIAIVPSHDAPTVERLTRALGVEPALADEEPPRDARGRLAAQLFSDVVASAPLDASVELFSAPGESRESVEITRRVLAAARAGVRFDRMAILTHAPERYRAHLVEALGRARVPAHFSRGARRPDPSGRALLALLACREEGLSARAFGEYLSLGVVPDDQDGAPPDADREVAFWPPDDELAPGLEPPEPASEQEEPRLDGAVVQGALRAPWRWERLLVDAAVVGGVDRWRRRLDRLARRLDARLEAVEDPDDPRLAGQARRREDLAHLRDFALPLIEALAELPGEATWGEWAERLTALATRALRDPAHAHAVLRELAPMGPIGPVGLAEVRLVLARRLTEMSSPPSGSSAGKLFVGSTAEARGLCFDVVFVPGLAERVFPRKIIGDPIVLDAVREALDAGLATARTQIADERLALRIAVGAARQRVVLSYPRMDTERGRPRVPSFYALEVMRAIEGRLPTFEELATRAERAGEDAAGARAWPAPARPEDAIDDAEYDLAVLRELLDTGSIEDAEGGARYLVEANEHLARALRRRWSQWDTRKWTRQDGMITSDDAALAALAAHRPAARAYSPTSLEQLARCPYRFFLRSILRLAPAEAPEPLEVIDPLSRGTLTHAIQFAILGRLRAEARLPLTEAHLAEARRWLDEAVTAQASAMAEELAPAIDRVWRDAVADIRADLAEWLERMAERPDWVPIQFELAFGLPPDEGHDPASVPDPLALEEGLRLRGSIDVVERSGERLRATDHKTGRTKPRPGVIVGGTVLQPLLYARALEALHPGVSVAGGRLYYCTSRGGFEERTVRLDAEARHAVALVAETLDELVGGGFLPAAPAEGECRRCDYRAVCGPAEERRLRRKDPRRLRAISRLRKQP